MNHVYKQRAAAEQDLVLFSKMNMHEDKVLAMVSVDGGFEIVPAAKVASYVCLMAVNGRVFKPV